MTVLSVIVPAYNAARTLPKTLESVQAQTLKELECMVVDDASDDNSMSMRRTAEIACELTDAAKDLIVDIPAPARQTVIKWLSMQKLRSVDWRPTVEVEEGTRRTLEWVKTLAGP